MIECCNSRGSANVRWFVLLISTDRPVTESAGVLASVGSIQDHCRYIQERGTPNGKRIGGHCSNHLFMQVLQPLGTEIGTPKPWQSCAITSTYGCLICDYQGHWLTPHNNTYGRISYDKDSDVRSWLSVCDAVFRCLGASAMSSALGACVSGLNTSG